MTSASLTSNFKNSGAQTRTTSFKEMLYERAIGQHLYKSVNAHSDPTRYGDFEVKGRVSDF
jgi:hypothetical protein